MISPRKPSRAPVRAPALAMLALAACCLLASPASAATTVPTRTTSGSQLAELLRKYRQQGLTKTAASAGRANGATSGGANAPTTTYAPSGGATAPGGGAAATTSTAPTAATTPAPTTPPAQATAASKARSVGGDRPLSTGAIVIAALAALLVLGCLAWAFARSRAFEPHWLIALRHAAAEAGFRASATWSELVDWARLGR